MKLIIAGGRQYQLTPGDCARLDKIHAEHAITEVVSGTAKGADTCGAQWAKRSGIPVREFRPDWGSLGAAAGPIRNEQMAEYADAAAVFPGGKGTMSMLGFAQKHGLRVFNFMDSNAKADLRP